MSVVPTRNASSSDRLLNQLASNWKSFSTRSPYLTATRKNGLEIITIFERQIKITNLTSDSSYKLNYELTFDPKSLVMNKSEELLCVYDDSNCSVVFLNPIGSKINYTAYYKLSIDLKENEKIIQILFNNISKFNAELIVLTSDSIRCYDINSSLNKPVQTYEFKAVTGRVNLSMNFSNVVDPVSISFGSCVDDTSNVNPKGDLTLFILTSDTSIYKIYPFLPHEISVSKSWLSTLFDYVTLKFNSASESDAENEDSTNKVEQSSYSGLLPMLKLATLLSKTDGSGLLSDILPKELMKAKITGPLTYQPFPVELYEQDALKLISMQNDLLCILLNQAVVIIFDDQDEIMVFDSGKSSNHSNGEVTVVECILFNEKNITLTDAILQPPSSNVILVTTTTPEILRIDCSSWCTTLSRCLEKNDLSDFIQLLQSPLPTGLINFGSFTLPHHYSTNNKPSKIGLGLSSNFDDYEVPLISNQFKIWLAWDGFKSFAVVLNGDKMDLHDITLTNSIDDGDDDERESYALSEFTGEDLNEDDLPKYETKLNNAFTTDIMKELQSTKMLISRIQAKLLTISNNKNIDSDSKDLNDVYQISELTTTGLIAVFKNLGLMNKRLLSARAEFMHQINTLNTLNLSKDSNVKKMETSIERLGKVEEKQETLKRRLEKIVSSVENAVVGLNNPVDVELSRDEVLYFRELNKTLKISESEEAEIEKVENLLKNLKNSDIDKVLAAASSINSASGQRLLSSSKNKLTVRGQLIDSLVGELSNLKVE